MKKNQQQIIHCPIFYFRFCPQKVVFLFSCGSRMMLSFFLAWNTVYIIDKMGSYTKRKLTFVTQHLQSYLILITNN